VLLVLGTIASGSLASAGGESPHAATAVLVVTAALAAATSSLASPAAGSIRTSVADRRRSGSHGRDFDLRSGA
jgi:hypothetical protein